ncbi:hypothetical protein, partial [Paraburkholderia unamae]|uniref:hypothetical protein n=1 Tax=Paraburkholderia unamae TaxID=219649 RepID=UPI001AD803C4
YAMSLGEMPDFSLGDLTGALIVSFLTAIMIAAVMVGYLLFAGLATRKTVTCFYPERQPAAAPDNHGYLIRGNFITGVIAFWLSAFFGLATKPFDAWLPPHVAGVAQGTYWLALCSNVLLLLLDWRKRRRSFKYVLFAVLAGSVAFLAVLGYASAMGYVTEPHVRPTPQTAAYFSPAAVGYWLSNTRARLLRNQLIATAAAVSLAFSIVTVGLIRVTRGHREANRSGRTPPPFFKNPDRKLLAAKACATVVFGFCSLVIFPFLDALASASPLRMQATTALTGGGYLILLNLAAFVVTGWKQRAGLGVAAFFLLFFVLQIPSGNMTLFPRMVVDTLGFGDRHATNIVLAGTECPVLAPYGADCSATKDANIGITNVNILNRLGSTVLIELQVRRTGVQPTGPL